MPSLLWFPCLQGGSSVTAPQGQKCLTQDTPRSRGSRKLFQAELAVGKGRALEVLRSFLTLLLPSVSSLSHLCLIHLRACKYFPGMVKMFPFSVVQSGECLKALP